VFLFIFCLFVCYIFFAIVLCFDFYSKYGLYEECILALLGSCVNSPLPSQTIHHRLTLHENYTV